MSIKYDRLWRLLDEQGISKDAVRKAAGLTALAFSKIENNTSISIEALLKVCAVLNCKLEDIAEWDYAYQTEHAIPDIDLDELPTSQFDTLGYHKLYDLPIQFTAEGLSNYLLHAMEAGLLSAEACKVLSAELLKHGFRIELPDAVDVLLDGLPHEIPEIDEDGTLEPVAKQKIGNAIRGTFNKIVRDAQLRESILDEAKAKARPAKVYWVEEGLLHSSSDGQYTFFEGKKQYRRPLENTTFMVDTYLELFGNDYSIYLLSNMLDKIGADAFCEKAFASEDASTKELLKIILFYPLDIDELLQLLGLPVWESFRQVFRQKIRWLRHPRRLRNFYRRMIIQSSTCYYDEIEAELEEDFQEKSKTDRNVFELLSDYYEEDVISQAQDRYYEWFDGSHYSINQLPVSWKENYILKAAGIETLQDLFQRIKESATVPEEGSSSPAADVYQKMKHLAFQFVQSKLQGDQAMNLWNYAKTAADSGRKWPIEECGALTNTTKRNLYHLKYRDLAAAVDDFRSGKLQNLCANKLKEQEAGPLLTEVEYVVRSGYPAIHFVTDTFWSDYLDRHPEQSLQSVREAYLRGEPLGVELADLDKNISALFPGDCPAFRILRETRDGNIHWREFPAWLLSAFQVAESGGQAEWTIESAFLGKEADSEYGEAWMCATIRSGLITNTGLYKVDCNPRWSHIGLGILVVSIPQVDRADMVLSALWDSISFCCQFVASSSKFSLECTAQYQYTVREFWKYIEENSPQEISTELMPKFSDETNAWKNSNEFELLMDTTIDKLDMSVRSFNCLARAGIQTVRELVCLTTEDLMKIRNMGKKSIIEIQDKLHLLGLS